MVLFYTTKPLNIEGNEKIGSHYTPNTHNYTFVR